MPAASVVDANVWLTGDGGNSSSSKECRNACQRFLTAFGDGEDTLILDENFELYYQFQHRLQPGGILQDLLNELFKKNRVRFYKLKPVAAPPKATVGDWYHNVPSTGNYPKFHSKDRKIVSLAIYAIANFDTSIANATDGDWCLIVEDLKQSGIEYVDVCGMCEHHSTKKRKAPATAPKMPRARKSK